MGKEDKEEWQETKKKLQEDDGDIKKIKWKDKGGERWREDRLTERKHKRQNMRDTNGRKQKGSKVIILCLLYVGTIQKTISSIQTGSFFLKLWINACQ
jgi:hypothetical protein